MSRRKQSHPKPIKRLPGDESIDKELEDELEAKKIDSIKKEEILPMPAHSSSTEEMDVDPDVASLSASPDPTADSPPRTFNKSGTLNDSGTFNDYEHVHVKSERTSSRNSCLEASPKTENDVLTTPPAAPPRPQPPPPHPVATMPPAASVTSTKCEILRLVKSAGDELQVCCTIPLAKGSCLGPFCGDVTDEDAADTLLEFTEDNGNTVYVRLLEESASWLKLLSKPEETPKNCIVFYEAGRIWCRLTVDLTPESALAASFTFLSDQSQSPKAVSASEKDKSPTVGTGGGMPTSNAAATPIKREETDTSKHAISLPGANTEIPVFSALIYQCPYCGVRFSKPSTLEGHLLYYCSKKPPPSSSSSILTPNEAGNNGTTPATGIKKRERNSSTGSDDEASKKIRLESEQPVSEADESDTCTESGSPLPKAIKTGQLYQCPCCSYSAEKLSGLNRHRRIHNRPTKDTQETTPKSVLKSETFCKECNIQFSSSNTYRGHKKFYCARRNKEVSREGSPVASSKPDVEVQSPVNSLTPVTHHVPNIPFHVTANSSVLSTQTAVIVAAPILTPNGVPSLAFTVPTVIVQPVVSSANLTQPAQAHQTTIPFSSSSKDQPLDLSTKKEEGKGDEKSAAAAQVSPAISETSESKSTIKEEPVETLTTERKSASENSSSSSATPAAVPTAAATSNSTWPSVETTVLNQLFNHNINQYPHQPKQILTSPTGQAPATTSVSKCLECNIVFYKHENFVAHKQHYCASRRAVKTSPQISPKLSPRETDAASSAAAAVAAVAVTSLRKPSPELTSRPLSSSASNDEKLDAINSVSKMAALSNESIEKSKANVSYFCVPCKIKFSSASTLKAHKDYYCPHGKNSEQSLILCKNDSVSESSCSEADDNSLEDNFYTCTHCCTSYTSSRLYRHHYCPANMQNPMVRCPHCDYVAPTQNKLSEHMKAHATSRGYKCLLCGYRGNTVRGMRMHGKTHTDSGQEFSEKHVLEVEEPPVLPVSYKNGTTDTYGSMDVEAELIRLKNEPYKRRRSRKSYERIDIPNHELLHACKICGETFSDLHAFQMHSTIHQTSQMVPHTIGRPKSVVNGKQMDDHQQDNGPSGDLTTVSRVEQSVSSTLSTAAAAATSGSSTSVYPYSEPIDSKASLKLITEKMGPKSNQNAKQPSPTSTVGTTTPPPATAMHFKYEADSDPKINYTNVSPTLLHRFPDAESPRPATTSATISGATPTDLEQTVNSLGSVIQIKSEPVDRGYDKAENGTASADSPPPTTSAEVNVKREIDQSASCERKEVMIPQSSLKEGPKILSHSKLEIPSHSLSSSSSLPIPPPSSSSPHPSSPSTSSKTAASTAFSTTTSAPAAAASSNTTPLYVYNSQYLQGERTDPSNHTAEPQLSKYCQQCDISFTYLATFLAHKKHYCSARLPDNKPSVTA